jgi:tripartite-type tricarboxylate transporter receptor subunit TctC
MTTLARPGMLAFALVACSFTGAVAQVADFPNKAITLVVPLAPGGSNDILARLVGQKLERKFGKPVIIENRPGAGGITAALGVVRGASDGYTLITASSTMMSLNITIRKHIPYDPRKDLTPIALLARVPFALVVNPALPVKSVDDLVKLAKEKPGQLSFATPGPGTFHHLNAEIFKSTFGLSLVHVPYKGTAPGLQDVAAGHVSFMFADVPPARALIESGKVRALGVTTAQRIKAVPDVPPLAEVGIPNYNAASWHTITTTGGVPKDIVDKLAAEIRAVMSEPEVQDLLSKDGTLPQVSPSPDAMKKFVSDEIARWGEVITKAGIAGSQ